MASINKTRGNGVAATAQTLASRAVTPAKTYGRTSHNYRTHEGSVAYSVSEAEELRRAVLTCMLWEDGFYENGVTIAQRIAALIPNIEPEEVVKIAYEARTVMKLRHVPLLMAIEMLKHPEHKKYVRKLVSLIVGRADEMGELLSLYWKDELNAIRDNEGQFRSQRAKRKIPMQLLRGIRSAFAKFDDYQILKYLNTDKPVTMADVIRLVHPDPREAQKNLRENKAHVDMAAVYKSVVDGTARAPEDTWEVSLSAAGKEGKQAVFEDLLDTNKLPAMALLRNLRGMLGAGVSTDKIQLGLDRMKVERVLPYRFITARRYAPALSQSLETAMMKCLEGIDKLPGKTILLIDNSGSMGNMISGKSEMNRVEASVGISILAREMCEQSEIILFDTATYILKGENFVLANGRSPYNSVNSGTHTEEEKFNSGLRGFAIMDAIARMRKGGTDIAQAVRYCNEHYDYDRLIMFTDEQSTTLPPDPKTGSKGYVINVAPYQNGIGYGPWVHINGFSEATLAYIAAYEKSLA